MITQSDNNILLRECPSNTMEGKGLGHCIMVSPIGGGGGGERGTGHCIMVSPIGGGGGERLVIVLWYNRVFVWVVTILLYH